MELVATVGIALFFADFIEKCASQLMCWIYYKLPTWALDITRPDTFPLATRRTNGDFYTAVVPLISFRFIEVLNVDRVLRQFGDKQSQPNPPLNIDTFHKTSTHNDDGWWPSRIQECAPAEYDNPAPVVAWPDEPLDNFHLASREHSQARRAWRGEEAQPVDDDHAWMEQDRPFSPPAQAFQQDDAPSNLQLRLHSREVYASSSVLLASAI
ncbi:hypothetical protein PIB30_029160 [Stylosanthes scabra]|uniref:Uncharacterized protein n=1 Tax=Stylosanthes scabra TaxID=79078 RepID=A0ABU6YA43_9FABA|nr:hypothetical protein [Stylosanthes scabra]